MLRLKKSRKSKGNKYGAKKQTIFLMKRGLKMTKYFRVKAFLNGHKVGYLYLKKCNSRSLMSLGRWNKFAFGITPHALLETEIVDTKGLATLFTYKDSETDSFKQVIKAYESIGYQFEFKAAILKTGNKAELVDENA